MTRGRVLVVDDEPSARAFVGDLLARAGFAVTKVGTGGEALQALHEAEPDIVLLDVVLPDIDGFQVLERTRAVSDVPVMMLTARAGELEKVRGLRAGADDWVSKPFGRQELLARIDALLRRAGRTAGVARSYRDALVEIDFPRRAVTAAGKPVPLTPLEFKLLAVLVRHADEVLSHGRLLELVWGDSYGVSPDEVRTYVSYLRRKLRAAAPDHGPIETIRGFGYRYRAAAAV